MDAATESGTGKRTRTARKEGGQEKVQNLEPVKTRMPEMVRLFNKHKEAGEDYSAAVKSLAEDSGFNAKSVRQFVNAKAGEKFEERKRDAVQLVLLFEEGE